MSFRGTFTALITPFRDRQIDEAAFQALIERQIDAGIDGIVPVGTTGESPTVDQDEHIRLIELAVKFAAGRCQVIAGTGANSTREAVTLTQAAAQVGATGSLQVCPYYNKPSAEGLYHHYRTVADATALPLMLYSVPGRSGIPIPIEIVARLAADCPTIVGLKEAGGDVDRINQAMQVVPPEFSILSGDDPLTLPFMACGATGVVSVASNLIPDVMVRLVRACLNGSFDEALAMQTRYYPLFRGLMSLDTNPVPIKEAVAMQGHVTNELRLPLTGLEPQKIKQLRDLLLQFDLIE